MGKILEERSGFHKSIWFYVYRDYRCARHIGGSIFHGRSKFINLEARAKQRAIDTAILELNNREVLTWANQKSSSAGYDDDKKILVAVDYNIGTEYAWIIAPDKLGGTVEFKGISAALNRTPSTARQPAVWRR